MRTVLASLALLALALTAAAGSPAEPVHYAGTIGKGIPIQMDLSIADGKASGSYFYEKYKTLIQLAGTVSNGQATLDEFDEKGVKTARFVGKLDGAGFAGTWSSADGKKSMPFSLKAAPAGAGGAAGGRVKLQTVKIDRSKEVCLQGQCAEIKISYPKVVSAPAGVDAVKLAQAVQAVMDENWGRDKTSQWVKDARESLRENGAMSGMNWSLEVVVEATYNAKGILVLCESYSEFAGGAHGMSSTQYYNFDIQSARLLSRSDILQPGADQRLTPLLKADLHSQDPENEFTALTADNVWAIEAGGLRFIFNPYEIGPYVNGTYEVTIPWSRISDLVRPDGPVKLPL